MLDTIKIKLKDVPFRISAPERFLPAFKKRSFNELSETEKKYGGMKPYVTAYHLDRKSIKLEKYIPSIEIYEKVEIELYRVVYDILIELSVPKLLIGNNLEEISGTQYRDVIYELKYVLEDLGVFIESKNMERGIITKVHFAKNIFLPSYIQIQDVLSELSKAEMGKSYDTTNTVIMADDVKKARVKNSSEVLQLYCGSRDYAFYDKIKDIKNTKNKSIDKEKTPYEKEILEMYNLNDKEVFRFEYRLNNYVALKSEINKILRRSYSEEVYVKDIFQEELWREILQKSWSKILNKPGNQLALKLSSPKEDVLKHIMQKAKIEKDDAHSQNKAFISYGLASIIRTYGAKYLKTSCEKIWSKKACGKRLQEKIKEASDLIDGLPYSDPIQFIDKEITKFEKIKLGDL